MIGGRGGGDERRDGGSPFQGDGRKFRTQVQCSVITTARWLVSVVAAAMAQVGATVRGRTNVDRTGGRENGSGTEEKVGRRRLDFYRRPIDTGSVL